MTKEPEHLVDRTDSAIGIGLQHRCQGANEMRGRARWQRASNVNSEAFVRKLLWLDAGEHRHRCRAEPVEIGFR